MKVLEFRGSFLWQFRAVAAATLLRNVEQMGVWAVRQQRGPTSADDFNYLVLIIMAMALPLHSLVPSCFRYSISLFSVPPTLRANDCSAQTN